MLQTTEFALLRRVAAEQAESRAPSLIAAVVRGGDVLWTGARGQVDGETPTADTQYRIGSITKTFVAVMVMRLRDEGRLDLNDELDKHLAGTSFGHLTIAQLLSHTGGLLAESPGPWWERSLGGDWTNLLDQVDEEVIKHRAGARFHYSNFGYATLGRTITNVSGKPYQRFIGDTVFKPLGMASTTYDVFAVPDARLARGYRWENGQWSAEPMMKDGEFGAMGGVVTTANDYAKWVAHLLSGWPAKPQANAEGAVIRAMRTGGGIPHGRGRPGKDAPDCRMSFIYAGGLVSGHDCLLGPVLFHSGGYPGYGSHMLLLPETGVGVFAFSNRTYAAPIPAVWDAAGVLLRAGQLGRHPIPTSPALAKAYSEAGRMWAEGRIDTNPAMLAENMLMDRSAANWAAEFQRLKAESGTCETTSPIQPTGALSGNFQWRCTTGRITGRLLLAPTNTVQIQALNLARP